jgi:Archaeal S-adenosylmethionine synthetase
VEISEPLNASVEIVSKGINEDARLSKWKSEATEIAADWLDNIDKVTELIVNGKVRTF